MSDRFGFSDPPGLAHRSIWIHTPPVKPIVSPSEMRVIDAAASDPVEVLIEKAGWAVHREALRMLGGAYGKRVTVFVGPGNNGADGRVAARLLGERGVRCEIVPIGSPARDLERANLIIDACLGTGISRAFEAPATESVPVLAVDIPSGIDGATGELRGTAVRAIRTVTFGALKPGLLLGVGPDHAGEIVVVGLGLDTSSATAHLMEDTDVARCWPDAAREAHKWQTAVLVIGGSPGMYGAVRLAGEAAARAGAGLVAVATPGDLAEGHVESISLPLPAANWAGEAVAAADRFRAVVIGPGLDAAAASEEDLHRLLAVDRPLLIDAGALPAASSLPDVLRARRSPAVLTPHAGEFLQLVDAETQNDRLGAVRSAAQHFGSVVLLKGSPTVIAAPNGDVRLVDSGDERLATAGTGDVLSGVIGAALASGLDPLDAAALGAQVHGMAALLTNRRVGLLASDLLLEIPRVLDR